MAVRKKGASHIKQLHRLNRIEGQIRGISKMVEDQRYCIDIVSQIRAVKSALSSLEGKIVEEHLDHCVHKAISSKDRKEAEQTVSEIKDLLKKSIK